MFIYNSASHLINKVFFKNEVEVINLSQNNLIKKFNAFIKINNPNHIDLKLTRGLCHGFSVVHAAMAAIGQLNWWAKTLKEISQWDCKEESLKRKISIQNSTDSTLSGLFERAINYVLFHQGKLRDVGQHNVLKNYFEIEYHKDKSVTRKKVQSNLTLSGFLDKESMNIFLKPNQLMGNLCLIHTSKHVCTIRYDNKSWYFYHPNNKDGEIEFKTKSFLIDHIIESVGNNFSIEINSLENRNLNSTSLDQVYKNNREIIIKDCGLHLIIRHTPKRLSYLLKLAEHNDIIRQNIADALKRQDRKQKTALYWIADSETLLLPNIYKLADKHDNIREGLATALKLQDNQKRTGLQMIARSAPQQLQGLFELARKHNVIKESLGEAIDLKSKYKIPLKPDTIKCIEEIISQLQTDTSKLTLFRKKIVAEAHDMTMPPGYHYLLLHNYSQQLLKLIQLENTYKDLLHTETS